MRLVVENLTCERGGRRLFQGLGFAVGSGEALAVTGPNGAGKSSLLRLIAGLLRPAEGRVALDGGVEQVGAAAHFVGHLDAVKGALTASENLAFTAEILGGDETACDAALSAVGLEKLADIPARMFSAGQKRRLALARLMVVKRLIWLLDEPTTALDSDGQERFSAIAAEHLAGGGIVVAATHAPLKLPNLREIRLGGGAE
jgi:heme exporter protein A